MTDTKAPEPCANCDADDETVCGCCPACDTTKAELCVACGFCRCERHDDCVRPKAGTQDRAVAAVRAVAVVLAAKHTAVTRNAYGSCDGAGYAVAPGSEDRARVHHQLPPVDLTDPDRQSSTERWEEQRARVAEYADTLEAAGFTVDRLTVPTGPIVLAAPSKDELTPLLKHTHASPAEVRSLAELTERTHGSAAARPLWELAETWPDAAEITTEPPY
ncbi:hypothetical protein [Streptomyces scabiei]|uniref:hypothetical protein n=1 Tax=Streptomyces scabiei TaxID=1930 RepID=UPI001B339AF5|nr:hypothetical protein [Streptomyces sp. LBUM 1481]MBP5896359.1 hypothetical protein [Streptomyces sp. LBUM 1481]